MQSDRVVFPCELPNWSLVCDMLLELQEGLLNETLSAEEAAFHIQTIVEANQTTHCLDEKRVQQVHELGSGARTRARCKLGQDHVWDGMLKFLNKAERDERERFLFSILPNIIELAIRLKDSVPPRGLSFSRQQKGGTTVLTRPFIASILACSFLCLFPERPHDRSSKLNCINFSHFFKHLPQPSQIAKLRCFLHYFEQIIEIGIGVTGNITFHRQVAEKSALPTLEDLIKSSIPLCPLSVHPEGGSDDTGSMAIQVAFTNQAIGGRVLGQGREQEEIRFCTCPELISAMLFMENLEDNEAIIVRGFEQFSRCHGHGASLEYSGPYKDKVERDSAGNLWSTLCVVDVMRYSWGGHNRQYLESFILREITKVFVGFSRVETFWLRKECRCVSSDWEDDFVTAPENADDEDSREKTGDLKYQAHAIACHLLSQGLAEAAHRITSSATHQQLPSVSGEDSIAEADDLPFDSRASSNGRGQTCSTPHDISDPRGQAVREELVSTPSHGTGGNGERVSLPMLVRLPQNGSCDLLEVDYSEWLANFRRRSSQLSDLTSRRSSSSTKHSSEFSSDLEEIYENLVQVEKLQHGIIEEEYYGTAISDYAAQFVDSVLQEGTSTAAQLLPGMRHFDQLTPPEGVHRPTAVRFASRGVLCDFIPAAEDEDGERSDYDFGDGAYAGGTDEAVSNKSKQFRTFTIPNYAQKVTESVIKSGTAEASLCLLAEERDVDSAEIVDDIPDDVYRWFADKIVQEVFAHVVDELYFQKFTSESCWRTSLSVSREGIPHRLEQMERTNSVSSSGSSSSYHGNTDFQKKSLRLSAFQSAATEVGQGSEQDDGDDLPVSGSGCDERAFSSKAGNAPDPWPSIEAKKLTVSTKCTALGMGEASVESSLLAASKYSIPPAAPEPRSPPPQVQQLLSARFSAEQKNFSVTLHGSQSRNGADPCGQVTGALQTPSPSAQVAHGVVERSSACSPPVKSTITSASSEAFADVCCAVGVTSSELLGSGANQPSCLTPEDLNLDYYKVAATIVNQVFQSLPDYMNKSPEGGKPCSRNSPLYSFHSRRHDSGVTPRTSYEAAAMAIGTLDKGNVVRESYLSSVSGASTGSGDAAGPRRTRSQSPSKTWLSKRLSRETLTNAFLKAENKPAVKSYERRSSEPCQRSVTLSLQGYGGSCHINDRNEKRPKKSRTDDDLENVKADSWRRSSLDSISLDRRRSSCGFKDPVLSRFAQELMNADISVPQLFLVGSGSSISTTESRRSSMSGFRDTTLATFESELLNSSFGQTLPSPRHRHPNRSLSRESRLWKSDSSETEYWFPIPRRVGTEFQEELERINRCHSVDEVEGYADFIATSILQQAVSILHHDMKEVTKEDEDISIFSENMADQIIREGLIAAVTRNRATKRPSENVPGSASASYQDLSFNSDDQTSHSEEDLPHDFCDALDVPYSCVDRFAADLAQAILLGAMELFAPVLKRFVAHGRPIATGNWDWEAVHDDSFLKMAIQWIAASIAQAPQLMYFTLGDERLNQMDGIVKQLIEQNWTVGQLMTSIQAYCAIVLEEMDSREDATSASAVSRTDQFIPSQTLFDFLLCQLR